MSMARIAAILAVPALCLHQYMVWFFAPVAQRGLVQKVFYFHLPCAWWALISFLVVFIGSVGYLLTRKSFWDDLAGAGAEIGVLLSGLALMSGSAWARAEWGHWWLWDPKLTTALVMWYVYAGYLVLRASPMVGERKYLVSAVLGVVAFLDVPLVFFASKLWGGVHPEGTATSSGGMTGDMWKTMIVGLLSFGLLWWAILRVRYRQRNVEKRLEALLVIEED